MLLLNFRHTIKKYFGNYFVLKIYITTLIHHPNKKHNYWNKNLKICLAIGLFL